MVISQAYVSPNHESREGAAIRLLILHATVGSAQSALHWLCNPTSGVSTHYLIDKPGKVYQLVRDDRRAYHAGKSAWDGTPDCNDYSIGVELENRNDGKDPYPIAQMQSLRELTKLLWRNHPTLRNVATHAEVALPVGRKTDPAGFDIDIYRAWVASLDPSPVATSYTEQSPILGTPLATRAQLRFSGKHGGYTALDVDHILNRYYDLALSVSVDPCLAIAQMLHETADMTSFWSQRPQRNPAGIGVTGQFQYVAPINKNGWKYNTQRNQWERGLSFSSWADDAIPVHIGRLLSYAIPAATGTQEQQALIQRSNAARPLPIRARGSATILRELGHVHNPALAGWASPGETYGIAIAARANRLIGYAP